METGNLVVEDRTLGRFLVHRSVHTDPAILALESERIFDRSWLYVGHESEIPNPGDFHTREVGGRPLLFCRDSDGKPRVLFNTCTHRGAQVCRERSGNARSFQCFYHAWTFNTRGELIGVPDAGGYGEAFRRDELGLKQPARVEAYRGLVFLSFDRNIVPLTEWLAGAREVLDVILDQGEQGMEVVRGTHEYSVRANWKLIAENSTDHGHGMPTHQTYFNLYLPAVGVELRGLPREFQCMSLGNGHAVMEYALPWGRPVAQWLPRWGEQSRVEIEAARQRLVERWGEPRARRIAELNRNLVIYPNLVINDIMAVVIRTFHPCAVDRMNVTAWTIAPIGEQRQSRARRLDNFLTFLGPGGLATPDDNEAMEACQRGYRAAGEVQWSELSHGMADRHGDIADDETLRAWWRRWAEQMAPAPASRRRLKRTRRPSAVDSKSYSPFF
ncbi:MAG: Rieske 2Fe-2S domain-containing protein [Candidatus Binataceae bacterium]|nr:Rieske 2Fe-2S domain-containing protein [Candidatus Binataceae bacterium]